MITSDPFQTMSYKVCPVGFKEIRFMDLPLLSGEPAFFAEWLVSLAIERSSTPAIIEHVNLNNCCLIRTDPELVRVLPKCASLIFDGIGMKIAAFIHGIGWIKDLNGTDLFPVVAERVQSVRVPIFFLGSSEDRVRLAVENTRMLYPAIEIRGCHSGYFSGDGEETSIVTEVNRSGARILLLGLGVPLQDHFALRNRDRLDVSVIWAVGGLFDFLSGANPRAPLILRLVKLEWLFRFALEPRRMWRRNVVVAPLFFAGVLKQRILRIFHGG